MGSSITVVGVGADGGLRWRRPHGHTFCAPMSCSAGVGISRRCWPPPRSASRGRPRCSRVDDVLARHAGRSIVALASGDPLVSGIGSTLIRRLGRDAVHVIPAVSSVSLARARMGWAAEDCETVTLVGRNVDALRRYLSRDRRLIVLKMSDASSLDVVARILVDEGFGAAPVTLLSNLGSETDESRRAGTAREFVGVPGDDLSLLCIECAGAEGNSTAPGLPDECFEHDGQLSKRPIRVAAVCALAPKPGQLLWDVGAGAGSVGIEWARTDPSCRTIALERNPSRAEAIERNASRLPGAGLYEIAVVTKLIVRSTPPRLLVTVVPAAPMMSRHFMSMLAWVEVSRAWRRPPSG